MSRNRRNPLLRALGAGLAAAAVLALLPAPADAAVRVVTTTEGLAALAREVGGDRVKVESLSRGIQDPHFVDPNPALAVKLRDADLLVDVGLDLEIGWLPPLVTQSRNADIQPNGSRRLTAASAVQVLDVPTGAVDRSQGDIHPSGNPHYLADPRRAAQVAAAIAARLSRIDPAGASSYQERVAAFQGSLAGAAERWRAQLAPARGRKVVTHHKTLTYLLDFAGVEAAAYLEPKAGVAPPPSHLADVVGVVQASGVRGILVESYYDRKPADLVGRLTGAKVLVVPGDVGGTKEASDYVAYVDALVQALVQATR
jgi:zinc/manganese transport system substrate-binding protein